MSDPMWLGYVLGVLTCIVLLRADKWWRNRP